jgi:hypothetical protein
MQALVDFIVRNLMALWPIAMVEEWEIAVMMRNGRIHRTLGTGLHWRWLFIEECKTWPSQEIVIDLPVGSCTTADGHTLTVSANLGYKVADYTTYLRSVWNGEASIKATAIGFLTSTVAGKDWQVMATDRKGFERELCARFPAARINGRGVARLWNTSSVVMPEGDCRPRWVVKLDKAGFAISTGSACTSGLERPSPVLTAMGLSAAEAGRALRFSGGWLTAADDWAQLFEGLVRIHGEIAAAPETTARSRG